MYSYNNIIEKDEPKRKEVIDTVLGDSSFHKAESSVTLVGDRLECIVVENFLSDDDCDKLLQVCEDVGYTFWKQKSAETNTKTAAWDEGTTAVREVDTIEANFPTLSRKLFERVKETIELKPKYFSETMENAEEVYETDLEGEWVPHALSENLLFGRYGTGGHFMPHIDGSTIVDLNTRSMYTLLIYLNDCPAGGETHVFKGEQGKVMYLDETCKKYRGADIFRIGTVQPRKGSAAFFYYDLLHEGAPVLEGKKYICRADVLYRRNPPILTSEKDQEAFNLYQSARLAESNGRSEEASKMFQKVRKISPGVAKIYQLD